MKMDIKKILNGKNRVSFLLIIVILIVISGLYATYALNVFVDDAIPDTYDMALDFDLAGNVTRQMTIKAGKSKVFDMEITNPYADSIKYGVAYSLVNPTTLPSGVTIAESSVTTDSAVGLVDAGATARVSIVVDNTSSGDVTLQFSVINGYKNGGDLIVPTGKTLVEGSYSVVPIPATEVILADLHENETCTTTPCVGLFKFENELVDGTTSIDYRYVGGTVNNYVKFNDDMYRIVGIFDENSHGVEGKYLVKLVSAYPLGSYSWGVYNTSNLSGVYSGSMNDWTGSTVSSNSNINVLLNEFFYNKMNTSITYGNCSDWTYIDDSSDYRTNNCSSIVGYGIKNSYRNYIEDVTWYLTGPRSQSAFSYKKQYLYMCERAKQQSVSISSFTCQSGNDSSAPFSANAKIGLLYASDYIYASGNFLPTNTTSVGNSNYFSKYNWLSTYRDWSITAALGSESISSNSWSYYMYTLAAITVYRPAYIRPSFYLKSNVSITGGEGTYSNPYTLRY